MTQKLIKCCQINITKISRYFYCQSNRHSHKFDETLSNQYNRNFPDIFCHSTNMTEKTDNIFVRISRITKFSDILNQSTNKREKLTTICIKQQIMKIFWYYLLLKYNIQTKNVILLNNHKQNFSGIFLLVKYTDTKIEMFSSID